MNTTRLKVQAPHWLCMWLKTCKMWSWENQIHARHKWLM